MDASLDAKSVISTTCAFSHEPRPGQGNYYITRSKELKKWDGNLLLQRKIFTSLKLAHATPEELLMFADWVYKTYGGF